jgi:hypothetical protein
MRPHGRNGAPDALTQRPILLTDGDAWKPLVGNSDEVLSVRAREAGWTSPTRSMADVATPRRPRYPPAGATRQVACSPTRS